MSFGTQLKVPSDDASPLKLAKGAALWAALGASAAVLVGAGLLVWSMQRTNAAIRALAAGKDIAVDAATAPPALLEARADFLLARDRVEDAQPFLDQASLRAESAAHARMLYNIANARLRAAIAATREGKFDKATPLVTLAKVEYRNALRIDPTYWNAKYNLDIAMRLVRDLPRGEGEDETKPEETPSKLWTDLPGVPKGLP
jgi:mxaK protein